MKIDVLLGLQWGDEGKGKIVDFLTPNYDIVARFQGGPNAGHSLEFNGEKIVLHTIPSGIFRENVINIIGNGVVIYPVELKKEIDKISSFKVDVKSKLFISRRAHLILPTHKFLDAAFEESKGKGKIGSTLKGITPTYVDKTGRNGLRVGDIMNKNFIEQYNSLTQKHIEILKSYNFSYYLTDIEKDWFDGIKLLKSLKHIDCEHFLNQNTRNPKKILAEGAQGTMLDIDFGSYPFVTSSSVVSAGACIGLGISPKNIREVIGITKAYCTRVGSGPFPTELNDETGEKLRKVGCEFGATTGRPRRCGWIDLPALKYAIMLNGVTKLIMTKADVLSGFETIKVCTHYLVDGEEIDYMPYDIVNKQVTPVLKEMKGWKQNLTNIKSINDLPQELNEYILYLEKELKVPIVIISVGPDREQTLIRK